MTEKAQTSKNSEDTRIIDEHTEHDAEVEFDEADLDIFGSETEEVISAAVSEDETPPTDSTEPGVEKEEEKAAEDEEAPPAAETKSEEQPPAVEDQKPKEEGKVQPPPEAPAFDAEKLQADYEKWRSDAEELLATQHYNLSEEQAEQLASEPEKVIPRLAAKLHMEVMQNSVAIVMKVLPQLMQSATAAQTAEQQAVDKFYTQWPELKEYHSEVVRFGRAYRQLNPKATLDQMIRDVGAQVVVANQLNVADRTNGAAAPVAPSPVTPAAPPPKPLAATAKGASKPGAVQQTMFEQLDEDYETFEQDYQ